jgi:hypothetical protein
MCGVGWIDCAKQSSFGLSHRHGALLNRLPTAKFEEGGRVGSPLRLDLLKRPVLTN